jgi:uncharacterized membrane protein
VSDRQEATTEGGGERRCTLCGRSAAEERLVRTSSVRSGVAEWIAARHPGRWPGTGFVGHGCLAEARLAYEMERLEAERGALTAVEEEVARRALDHEAIARDFSVEFDRAVRFGDRLADRIARFGGSWRFILIFAGVCAAWIALNGVWLRLRAFDPYPFILLNLGLSCLAALQAPVILMAQNRQAARDRAQADHDFRINLKAEIEIKSLHEKVDHLLHAQWERMVELQELQLEMLQELAEASDGERATELPPPPGA